MTRPGAPLARLLTRAVSSAAVSAESGNDARVLDAALVVLARRGTREATMDDIAEESGVSRATLFRRFGGKDQLFERSLARMMRLLLAGLAQPAGIDPDADPIGFAVETFTICMGLNQHILVRESDTLRRAELLHALEQGDPSPLSLAHRAVARNIASAQNAGRLPVGDADLKADALIHLVIGYLVSPSAAVDLTDSVAAREFATRIVVPIMLSEG